MAESLQPGSGTWGPAQPAMLSTLPSPILILKGLGALPADNQTKVNNFSELILINDVPF